MKMTMNKYVITIVLMVAAMTSCEDFLSKGNPNAIDAPSYFKTENDLQTYANGFLQTMIPTAESVATGDDKSDYMAWRGEWQYLTDNYDADDQSGWSVGSWEDLRNINYFLANFRQAEVSEEVLAHYEGVARFWRAYFYWNKVKTFGAVPFYDSLIDESDKEALYKGRDSREFVMQKVLEDINYACEHCLYDEKLAVNSVRITKNIALAMKARICLYEGTFRKYHAFDPSTGQPWTKDESRNYLRECISACEALMGSGLYGLHKSDDKASQYRELFISERVHTDEVIWARVYNTALNVTHTLNNTFTNMQYGSLSLTKQFVNTYLNLDGSRFTDKEGYDKVPFTSEFAGRDLRLAQSVRHPGYTRKNESGKTVNYAPDFVYCVTGYHPIKWVIDDASLDKNTSPCGTCIPIIRYAEVLLDYAEAKAELGEMDAEVWNRTIRPLRERAGVSGDMPTSADPYMQQYFLDTVTDMYVLEVRRERGVELLLEDLRYDDVMRWSMGKLFEQPWYGIYVGELGKTYDLDGNGKDDVCFVEQKPSSGKAGVTYIEVGTENLLTGGTQGYLNCYVNMIRKWDDKKYVRPIPTSAINDNPALGQNPGW